MNAEGAGLFAGLSERIKNPGQTLHSYGAVIYALAIAIGVAVIVLVVDQFYPFLPMNPLGTGPSAAARTGKTFWRNETGENLIVPVSQSPTTNAANYTMSVQFIVGDSRTPDIGMYRHIVHRGANPCGITAPTAGPTGHAGITPTDIPAASNDPNYVATGLPSIMNPGVFMDKYKNDIHVFVHTKGQQDGAPMIWLESVTIPDVPLNTPMTLGISCSGQQLDVYLNCRLFSSTLLRGTPYMPTSANQWFGRYCAYPMSGLVKNLELWPVALGSTDYAAMCSISTPSFDLATLPAICPSTGTSSSSCSAITK